MISTAKPAWGLNEEMAPAFSEAAGVMVVAGIYYMAAAWYYEKDKAPPVYPQWTPIAFIAIFSQVLRPAKAMVVRGQHSKEEEEPVKNTRDHWQNPLEVKRQRKCSRSYLLQRIHWIPTCWFCLQRYLVLKDVKFYYTKRKDNCPGSVIQVQASTIADLIPRFYDVTAGAVLIDEINVRDYKMESLRSVMSFVTQEIFLFNDTIFNNIALGRPDATEEEVVVITKLPMQWFYYPRPKMATRLLPATAVSAYPVASVSGTVLPGQFKTLILILDEATSALDTESERTVQDALGKLIWKAEPHW